MFLYLFYNNSNIIEPFMDMLAYLFSNLLNLLIKFTFCYEGSVIFIIACVIYSASP